MDEQQARRERMRAARRRKILANAESRMEKVCSLQQWSGSDKVKEDQNCREPSPAEDPPDELLVLPPPPPPAVAKTTPPPPPSLVVRWTAVLCAQSVLRARLLLPVLTGLAISCASVAMGYCVPCFLCLVTSELCLLLWTLITTLTNKHSPPPLLNPPGTMAMLKVALSILYPPATLVLDSVQHSSVLAGVVAQDLCLGLFSLLSSTAAINLYSSPEH